MQSNQTDKKEKEQARLIDAQVGLLQLAKELGNIRKACRAAKVSRSSFYEIKKAYEQFGRAGLLTGRRGAKPKVITEDEERRVFEMTRKYPSYSYLHLSRQSMEEGCALGESLIKRVWKKHGLMRKLDRFLWLDQETASGRGTMTEAALKAVRRLKALDIASEQNVQVTRPGELICQDLYLVGTIKGVGRIYAQSAIDCFTSVAFTRLCLTKRPLDSVALVHERLLPFYDAHGLKLEAILTDGGREYCGTTDGHLFELYLGSQNIEHRVTKPASPWTNGFIERFHRTLKDEFFAKAFREKWYDSIEALQKDLDAFLEFYNERRSHGGYRTQGRTPMKALKDFLEAPIHVEKLAA